MKRPTKAIIAAAGLGTRFLPQTKAMPKEMMPLIDKPIIQFVVEELVAAGIKDIIIVGSSTKRAIEDHFDLPNEELLANLRAGGEKKLPLLGEMESIANLANFIYLRQKGPYGNATPIMCAAHLIGDEPFIYTWADDFFVSKPGYTQQLIDTYMKYGGSVLACKKVSKDDEYDKYGIVDGIEQERGIMKVRGIVEKPGKEKATSNLASVSEYLYTPEFFRYLEEERDSFKGEGELMMQPAIQRMLNDGGSVYAREILDGKFYDTGDKLEYLKTIFDFGLSDKRLGGELRAYIVERLKD